MTHEITVKQVPARRAAVARYRAKAEEIGPRMGAAYGQVMAYLGCHGIAASGPALARYHESGDAFEVEAGFYVAAPFESGEGVESIELPAVEAAVTEHVGGYDTLPSAYEDVIEWAKAQGLSLADWMWDEYWTDPQTTPPAENRTEIIWPLKRDRE
jgi:effector-binding domain-containing protein